MPAKIVGIIVKKKIIHKNPEPLPRLSRASTKASSVCCSLFSRSPFVFTIFFCHSPPTTNTHITRVYAYRILFSRSVIHSHKSLGIYIRCNISTTTDEIIIVLDICIPSSFGNRPDTTETRLLLFRFRRTSRRVL